MTTEQIKTQIREFLMDHVHTEIEDGTELFQSGLLNSLFALKLVSFVERAFAFRVENEDLDLTNFNAIGAIAAFVERKTTR